MIGNQCGTAIYSRLWIAEMTFFLNREVSSVKVRRNSILKFNRNEKKEEKKNMNKLMKTVALGIASIALVACSSGSKGSAATGNAGKYDYLLDTKDLAKAELDLSNADGQLKSILDKGVLTVATSPDYPCAEWVDDNGTIYGSEMMLAKYIADNLGVELAIETMDFSGTFVAVDTGKTDLAISGYGWKSDRAENYELSIGYQGGDDDTESSEHTLITTAANAGKYNSLEDFVGSHIIAQATSLQEMYVQDEILALDTDDTTTYEPVQTLDQAILALAAGKCDAVALSGNLAENYVKESDGQFVETGVYFDLTPYGDFQGNVVLGKKGETSLMEAVNSVIKVAVDNGYYVEWYAEAKKAAGQE